MNPIANLTEKILILSCFHRKKKMTPTPSRDVRHPGRRWRTSLPDTEPIPGEDGAHPGLMSAAGLQSGIKVLIYCVYNDLFVSLHKQILSDEDI